VSLSGMCQVCKSRADSHRDLLPQSAYLLATRRKERRRRQLISHQRRQRYSHRQTTIQQEDLSVGLGVFKMGRSSCRVSTVVGLWRGLLPRCHFGLPLHEKTGQNLHPTFWRRVVRLRRKNLNISFANQASNRATETNGEGQRRHRIA
jgi:hypothetical protein